MRLTLTFVRDAGPRWIALAGHAAAVLNNGGDSVALWTATGQLQHTYAN